MYEHQKFAKDQKVVKENNELKSEVLSLKHKLNDTSEAFNKLKNEFNKFKSKVDLKDNKLW